MITRSSANQSAIPAEGRSLSGCALDWRKRVVPAKTPSAGNAMEQADMGRRRSRGDDEGEPFATHSAEVFTRENILPTRETQIAVSYLPERPLTPAKLPVRSTRRSALNGQLAWERSHEGSKPDPDYAQSSALPRTRWVIDPWGSPVTGKLRSNRLERSRHGSASHGLALPCGRNLSFERNRETE